MITMGLRRVWCSLMQTTLMRRRGPISRGPATVECLWLPGTTITHNYTELWCEPSMSDSVTISIYSARYGLLAERP